MDLTFDFSKSAARRGLSMSAGDTRDNSNKKPRFRIFFDMRNSLPLQRKFKISYIN
jgi:hypothetical protein